MGSVGDAYDNAMAESFFATLECELLDRCRFKTQAEARMAVFQFIEGFYNPRRRHSSLGYLSPIAFERQYAATALEPGAHEHAVVLAPVKERPGNVAASCTASVPAVRDSHSTRRRWQRAGRDEKMLIVAVFQGVLRLHRRGTRLSRIDNAPNRYAARQPQDVREVDAPRSPARIGARARILK
jgi:hypothetical protein